MAMQGVIGDVGDLVTFVRMILTQMLSLGYRMYSVVLQLDLLRDCSH